MFTIAWLQWKHQDPNQLKNWNTTCTQLLFSEYTSYNFFLQILNGWEGYFHREMIHRWVGTLRLQLPYPFHTVIQLSCLQQRTKTIKVAASFSFKGVNRRQNAHSFWAFYKCKRSPVSSEELLWFHKVACFLEMYARWVMKMEHDILEFIQFSYYSNYFFVFNSLLKDLSLVAIQSTCSPDEVIVQSLEFSPFCTTDPGSVLNLKMSDFLSCDYVKITAWFPLTFRTMFNWRLTFYSMVFPLPPILVYLTVP